jgi:hypothetical protein
VPAVRSFDKENWHPEDWDFAKETPDYRIKHPFFCDHGQTFQYNRVDKRAGPGSFADCFKGTACSSCGKIIEEVQTL